MAIPTVEKRIPEYDAGGGQVGCNDPAGPRRVRSWLLIGDLLILGIAVLVLVGMSRIAQGNAHSAPRIWNARSFDVAAVIQAWHPSEETLRQPNGWPGRDGRWQAIPLVAIVGPIGIEVVEQMHRNQPNARWSPTPSALHPSS
jgi:hypothetical protein